MNWVKDNITKILGSIMTLISTLMTMIASGTFDGLLEPSAIRWLGIFGMLISAAITGVGFNNSAKIRVAQAMETAIKSTPPEQS